MMTARTGIGGGISTAISRPGASFALCMSAGTEPAAGPCVDRLVTTRPADCVVTSPGRPHRSGASGRSSSTAQAKRPPMNRR